MKVDKHISELLYEHDCIIVPDFGGFVANYASAKIHPTQHTFTPPSKKISFNKNLKNNDGLLANHIASAECFTYPEALKYISHFVENINLQLKSGAKVKLDEVGTLFLDVERNIQFEPGTTNYLLDAFGLSEFQSPAIKRDTIGKRIEKEFKDRSPIPAENKEKQRINIKRYVALALTLPIVFGLVWIPLKTDLLKNSNSSNLNPFSSKEAAKYEVRKQSDAKVLTAEDFGLNTTKENTATSSVSIENPAVEPVKADSTKVVSQNATIDFKFHVVAGCFQIKANADKFVKELQSRNISASIIGKHRGLFVVSCGNYATRKEAYLEMDQLKRNLTSVWMLAQ